ncbi:MAG: hypothetical protein WAS49_12725, partial [Candidatus Dechloromonas phosphoritropha]
MRPADSNSQSQPNQCETQRLRVDQTFLRDQHHCGYRTNGGQGALEPRASVEPITEHGQGKEQDCWCGEQGPDKR